MKIDWTDAIIKLVIAILAATWSIFLARWLNNPSRRTSDSSTAKNILQKTWGWYLHLVLTYWFVPSISITVGVLDIWRTVHISTPPVTAKFVVTIAFDVSQICYGMVMFFFIILFKHVRLLSSSIVSMAAATTEMFDTIVRERSDSDRLG